MTIPIMDIVGYVLVFLRIGAIYFALPIIGDSPTPLRVRILLSLATAICVIPLLPNNWVGDLSLGPVTIGVVVIKELLIGLVLGFAARLAFDGLIMAASIVGYQMGFGTANLLVPDAQMQMDGFTAFHRILMILIFFSLNMHHTYIYAIFDTFTYIPLGLSHFSNDFAPFFIKATSAVFTTALQLAAPVLVALMFAMAALGLVARTVPQMNIFTISFPVSFFIGLVVYVSTFPFLPGWLETHFLSIHSGVRNAVIGLR